MNTTTFQRLGRSLTAAVSASIVLAACAGDTPAGPARQPALPNQSRAVDLGVCDNLKPPAGSKLAFRVYANGVQIYRWTGTSWGFEGPSAVLTADAQGNGVVGTHYAGPTWESKSGGTLVGTVLERCTPNPNAIAWLLLSAVSEGPGVFHRVAFIQRVNTVGGNAPANPGAFSGQEARVPYTTEYLFYRAH